MPTADVTIHLPGRTVPATLSTSRAESSYGQPVLVAEGGPSFNGADVAHGPGDVTSYGPACALLLDVEPDPEAEALLERWEALCRPLRREWGLSMAEEWLTAGGWDDGSVWIQRMGTEEERYLADELDRAPLEREVVRHVTETPVLRTRIPEGRRAVRGLEYGAHVSRPDKGWSGYHVRPEGTEAWGICRQTPAEDEVLELDAEVVDAIREELADVGAEGASWTFPDGTGVVEIGDTWDTFDAEGRAEWGHVVRRRP